MRCDESAFQFRARQISRRVDHRYQTRAVRLRSAIAHGSKRREARRDGNFESITKALFADRILREADRQDAEPTRGHPHERCAIFHALCFQRVVELAAEETPKRGAEVVDRRHPLRPALLLLLALEVVGEIGTHPATACRAIGAYKKCGQAIGCEFGQIDNRRLGVGSAAHHDQPAAERRDDRNGNGAARRRDAPCLCQCDGAPIVACTARRHKREQLAPERGDLFDGGGACGTGSGLDSYLCDADGRAQGL